MGDEQIADEARRLLDNATPGPWKRPSSTSDWFETPEPIQIDEADWGQEAQERGGLCGYRIGTLADERAWRYADVEFIAAAPRLVAGLLAERDGLVAALAAERTRADRAEAKIAEARDWPPSSLVRGSVGGVEGGQS